MPVLPSRAAVVLGALFPGTGHISAGARARGVCIMLAWGALLAVPVLAWERVSGAPFSGRIDHVVAFATLLACLASIWGWAYHDLAVRPRHGTAAGDSQWSIAGRRLRRNRLALTGLAVIVILCLLALLAPFLSRFDPETQRDIVRLAYLPPSLEHPFGTDRFGRDVLSRILFGARISLTIGFIAVGISITLGTALGAIAGYFGGRTDTILMRFVDVVLSFPRLILLIMVIALFGPSIFVVILVLGLTQWPGTTRLVRGEVLSLREREYVHAARTSGLGRGRIVLRHLLPNALAPVIVAATLGIGHTIVLEAGLSFLGLGVQPPTPSWGNMVADGRQNLLGAWWVATFPGLAIALTVLAFNLVGDGLRDALDPRMRH